MGAGNVANPMAPSSPQWEPHLAALAQCVKTLMLQVLPNHVTSSVYVPSKFFADQLTAFEVWISRGGSALISRGSIPLPPPNDRHPTAHLRKWNPLMAP